MTSFQLGPGDHLSDLWFSLFIHVQDSDPPLFFKFIDFLPPKPKYLSLPLTWPFYWQTPCSITFELNGISSKKCSMILTFPKLRFSPLLYSVTEPVFFSSCHLLPLINFIVLHFCMFAPTHLISVSHHSSKYHMFVFFYAFNSNQFLEHSKMWPINIY